IDRINHTREEHIITLEDPIEYLYRNDRCIISQREVRIDTADYVTAIRSSLRQAPDVILLGEMRDYETIRTGMTAAETGHLVLSTLHTRGAANTVDRIIDIFPPNQQQQIRVQLAFLLQEVISEQLLPSTDGGVVPAFEVMVVNNAVKNLIRDSKLHQIDSVIATSAAEGMISMDNSIAELYKNGRITKETAIGAAMNPDMMIKRLC
ncbi:MAG: type IV pili twitching motility protein PilT, partial [Clostridia bacterium]|nr:type IV pili twitching motility protein PilT [Clostridia bacterium]